MMVKHKIFPLGSRKQDALFSAFLHAHTGLDLETWLRNNGWDAYDFAEHRWWKHEKICGIGFMTSLVGAVGLQFQNELRLPQNCIRVKYDALLVENAQLKAELRRCGCE